MQLIRVNVVVEVVVVVEKRLVTVVECRRGCSAGCGGAGSWHQAHSHSAQPETEVLPYSISIFFLQKNASIIKHQGPISQKLRSLLYNRYDCNDGKFSL